MGDENDEKLVLVPRLRFPKFSEAWRADRVGKIAEIFKGKGIAKSDISNDGIHPCIRYGELYTVYGELVTEVLSRTSLPAADLFFGEPNDVIIPSSGETKEDIATAACVIPGGAAFGGDLNVLRTKENGAFLSYCLNGPLRRGIARVAQGDSVVHLYPHQIEKLSIAVPARDEQQKIADCLASLDELITAESQKLDALKTHKKGLMQQLFPREGETVPRLRFPEFRDAAEWEEKPLAEVCNVLQGYGFPEVLQGRSEGKYPFCKVSDISRAVADRGGLLDEASNYVGDDDLLSLRAKLIPKWATVFAKIGEALRLNRRAYVQKACLIDNNVTGLKAIDDVADDYFVYLLSQLIDLNKHCGGAVPSVNKTTLEEIEVVVPGLDEQKRIAESLSPLDDLIAAQSQKIDTLKTHKKGLMQQLFPVLEEVQP